MTLSTSLFHVAQHLRDQVDDRRTDVELLHRYAHEGDEIAFRSLVHRYASLVFGVARRQICDVHRAEDVFQATFLALARSADQLTDTRSLTSWLYTVAYRQARKAKRLDSQQSTAERNYSPSANTRDLLDELSGRELMSLIDEEIQRLPEKYRLPILLCSMEGLSREEAAERLGWTPGSVKGRLERGRQRLAARLSKRGIAPTLLVIHSCTNQISAALVDHTVELSVSPWAKSIPIRVVELLTSAVWAKGTTWLTLCCSMLILGLTAMIGWSEPPEKTSDKPSPQSTSNDSLEDPLPKQALRRFGTPRFRLGMQINNLAISPDGSFAIARGGRGPWESIRRFDLRDGRRMMALPKHKYGIQAIAIAPDGKTFATKQYFLDIVIYDAQTGKELKRINNRKDGLRVLYQTLITFSSGDCQIAIQFPFAEYTGNLAKTMASFFIGFFGCFPRYLASEKISYPALPHAFIMDDFE